MPDNLYDALYEPAPARNPRERVHSIASRVGITPDIADDYLNLTRVESGQNFNVRDSAKGAQGFGQVMPDRRGGSTRTISGRTYNLRDPDQNIEAGLRLFSAGGNDPVGRRLEYFGGARARQRYERTGRIPNISDGNLTAAQYVRATGAKPPKNPYDILYDDSPTTERTPPESATELKSPSSPGRSRKQSAPPSPMQRALSRMSSDQVQRVRDSLNPPEPIEKALARVAEQANQIAPQIRRQLPEPSHGVGELRRLDDPEVQRITQAQQAELEQNPVLTSVRRGRLSSAQARSAARQASENRAAQIQREQDEPEITTLTELYRADIRKQGLPQWLTETLSRGGAGVGEFGAGVGKLFAPFTRDPEASEKRLGTFRRHVEAMTRAAVAEGADRNVVSRTIQDATAGMIASSPEFAAMLTGVPAIPAFGAGSGVRAVGREGTREEIAKSIAHGLITGAAFEAPVPAQVKRPLTRAVTKGATVGGATAAIEASQGASPQQAIASGITNALFAGHGELGRARPEANRLREMAATEQARETGPISQDTRLAYPRTGLRERIQQSAQSSDQSPALTVSPRQGLAKTEANVPLANLDTPLTLPRTESIRDYRPGRERLQAKDLPASEQHDLRYAKVPPDAEFELRDINLADLKSYNAPLTERASRREPHPPAKTEGPIIVDSDLNILGGHHRADNAFRKGETSLQAWVRVDKLPEPVPEGYVRYYRADRPNAQGPEGQGWSNSLDYVSQKHGKGAQQGESVWYVDVPAKALEAEYGDAQSASVLRGDPQVLGATEPKLYRRVNETSAVNESQDPPEQALPAASTRESPWSQVSVRQILPEPQIATYRDGTAGVMITHPSGKVESVPFSSEQSARDYVERYKNEPQTKVQPPVEAQREAVEPAAVLEGRSSDSGTSQANVPAGVLGRPESRSGTSTGVPEAGVQSQKFYHRDYGEVTVSPNQRRVGKGRVRVVAEDGSEHVVKRPSGTGAGNQRAVPVRELEPAKTAPPSEPVFPREPSITAPKNAAMGTDRAELGLPELARSEPQSAQRVLDEAKLANQRDPRSPDRLTEQALSGSKNFTNVETMQLNLRAQEIKNRVNNLQRELYDAKDSTTINEKRVELDSLVNEFDRLSQAQRSAGKEWGRTGIARQRAINEDYSLVSMVARFKATAGRELTAKERSQIEDLSRRNAELEAQLESANDRLAKQRLQSEVDRMSRRQRRTQSKAQIDDEWTQLKNQFAEIRQREQGFFKSEEGSFDPEALKLIGKMVRNRVQAGVTNAEQLLDDIHAIVGGDRRELRDAISGYSVGPKTTRSDLQKQIDALRSELKSISKSEDIAAGVRSPRQEGPQREFKRDQSRQRAIERQIADLEAQMQSGQFRGKSEREPSRYTRETYRLQKELDATRAEYDRMKYRATATTGQKVIDTALGLGNAPKTLLSMGDFSALLRQGGYGSVTHPILSTRAAQDMLRSISERGFANVESQIKSHPLFEEAKRNGVEFTGIDKLDPRLSKREEGYLGSGFIDAISRGKFNPLRYTVKPIKDISERTFVSFLDSQRMRIYANQADAIRSMKGLTDAEVNDALKAQAKLVNIATGRGSLGARGNEYMPALNVAMFSPRLLASRIQLLNKMFNPVAWRNTPPGARKLMMIDNAKFLGFTLMSLGLAKAAGANVNLDPDDSGFLKIKIGNTRYDTLTGLQQPMRFFLRMVGYGGGQLGGAMRGGETYGGEPAGKIFMDFARSKTSPEVGYVWDALEGKNRLTGKKFEAGKDAARLVAPLPMQDFAEAIKTDGALRGMIEALPSLVGVGTQTYGGTAEKPTTHAEKLARRYTREKMPDSIRTQEEIDLDTQRSQLRARARRGENVSGNVADMVLQGKITERQAQAILSARSKTRLEEDLRSLGIKEALLVYRVADERQRNEIRKLVENKLPLVNALKPEEQSAVRDELSRYGFSVPQIRITRPSRESRPSRAER